MSTSPSRPASSNAAPAKAQRAVVELAAADLQGPGVAPCPNPKMPLWSQHPRVFLDVAHAAAEGAACPYCGTVYRLKAGEKVHGH
jgi:uncharacterized Zn-finger protein